MGPWCSTDEYVGLFSSPDVSKLLLAVAKAKSAEGGPGISELYTRAAEVIPPKLAELSPAQLIKAPF
eukprot:s6869_g1.t3